MFGPSGSGQTKFVHFLAQKLEKAVVVKCASDILKPLVGQTEQSLAAMFDRIEPSKEILFLDEADSFLQQRTRAHHSWEITQVNELLVQMENFSSLLFCATNFLEVLDSTVFRRFDFKVKLDYLRQDQTWELFKACIGRSEPVAPEMAGIWMARLDSIKNLTPGDFSAVKRRLTLMDIDLEPEILLCELARETALKKDSQKRRVGFVS